MTLSRYSFLGAASGCGALALVAVLVLGVGGGGSHHAQAVAKAQVRQVASTSGGGVHTGPGVHAPGVPVHASGVPVHTSPGVSVGANRRTVAAEAPDPEASRSFPAPASVHHQAAATPSTAAEAGVAPGAPSDAEVRRELNQMHAVERAARQQTLTPVAGGESIGGNGTIAPPPGIPAVVARVIAGANAIADFPYVFGGGHASFVDNAYDCSGSVSYALAAGGLLSAPETSGQLESWGAPGPGRWITVLANAGHTYMYVDGILYDTAGRSGVYASRWQVGAVDNSGYVVRHWPGL
jgi:cell wall-associated NlpC family hydrolase